MKLLLLTTLLVLTACTKIQSPPANTAPAPTPPAQPANVAVTVHEIMAIETALPGTPGVRSDSTVLRDESERCEYLQSPPSLTPTLRESVSRFVHVVPKQSDTAEYDISIFTLSYDCFSYFKERSTVVPFTFGGTTSGLLRTRVTVFGVLSRHQSGEVIATAEAEGIVDHTANRTRFLLFITNSGKHGSITSAARAAVGHVGALLAEKVIALQEGSSR